VRQRIQSGGKIDSHAYLGILAHRRESIARFAEFMRDYDLLLTPSLPFVAPSLKDVDEAITPVGSFARAINYLDTCAITLPAGFDAGLPIGVQLVAKPWQENLLLDAGQAFQAVTDWHRHTPAGLED
jgi:aspartyl-tRNA(Asn)/glutamyl-tRNA(Gln) amidotransferase subunit A